MRAELVDNERAELGIHGRERARSLLYQRNIQTAAGQRVGHLDPDVARADDHRRPRAGVECILHRGRVTHRVQHVHSGKLDSGDRGAGRDRAGRDHDAVVRDRLLAPVWRSHDQLSPLDVEPLRDRVEQQVEPGVFEIIACAVREAAPLADLAAEPVRNSADREVRICVGEHERRPDGRIELASAQAGGDPGIASANDHQSQRIAHVKDPWIR